MVKIIWEQQPSKFMRFAHLLLIFALAYGMSVISYYCMAYYYNIPNHIPMVIDGNVELQELKNFLAEDMIDENTWIIDSYDCKHFSRDLVENAKQYNITLGMFSMLTDKHTGHRVCYTIIENSTIYIEPQTDEIFLSFTEIKDHCSMVMNGIIIEWSYDKR